MFRTTARMSAIIPQAKNGFANINTKVEPIMYRITARTWFKTLGPHFFFSPSIKVRVRQMVE